MIGALHQFLKQQQALYGNELYLSNEPAPLSEPKPEKIGLLAIGKLDAYNQSICTCLKCPLGKTRTNFVFGVGENLRKSLFYYGFPL